MELKSEIWVKAHLRRCQSAGAFATIARRGNREAGAVLLKLTVAGVGVEVLARRRDQNGVQVWYPASGPEPLPEADADAYIARQIGYDPDLWVLEIEDAKGRHFLGDPVQSTDPLAPQPAAGKTSNHAGNNDGADVTVCICSWRDLYAQAKRLRATHVVSLLGIEGAAETPSGIDAQNHLHLDVDDIDYEVEGYAVPGYDDVARLLAFGARWQRSGPVVVHCYAGVSRSSAAALILLCQLHPGQEAALARKLRRLSPHAQPNRRLIEIADGQLDANGRLIAAVADMSPAQFSIPTPAVTLDTALSEVDL